MPGSNTSMDPYLHEIARKRPRTHTRQPVMPAQLDMLDTVAAVAVAPAKERIEEVRESTASKHRADIERGKPIAVAVASRDGWVRAETFREEATRRRIVFDCEKGKQRDFCWISTMFSQLCREGLLQKRRRADRSVVTEYSKAQHNDQVVYEPVPRSA